LCLITAVVAEKRDQVVVQEVRHRSSQGTTGDRRAAPSERHPERCCQSWQAPFASDRRGSGLEGTQTDRIGGFNRSTQARGQAGSQAHSSVVSRIP
jgi:hypothetical protein